MALANRGAVKRAALAGASRGAPLGCRTIVAHIATLGTGSLVPRIRPGRDQARRGVTESLRGNRSPDRLVALALFLAAILQFLLRRLYQRRPDVRMVFHDGAGSPTRKFAHGKLAIFGGVKRRTGSYALVNDSVTLGSLVSTKMVGDRRRWSWRAIASKMSALSQPDSIEPVS